MARTTIRTEDIADSEITSAKIADTGVAASDLASTLDLSGKTLTIPASAVTAAMVTAHVTAFDDNQLKEDIALLAFKQASSDSVIKYDLVDQSIDVFSDSSGIDASASTNELVTSNYAWGQQVVTPTATGGTITTDGDYKVHSFSADGTFTTDSTQNMAIFLVGGGGAGNGRVGPGGGGGGVVYVTSYSVSGASHAVVVGEGGATSAGDANVNPGEDSTFSGAITANGGGGGSPSTSTASGGSGGGSKESTGGASNQSSENSGISNLTQYGNAGGAGHGFPDYNWGGGGGAGAVGTAGTASALGNGGNGIANSITGSSVTYGGGGGSGQHGHDSSASMTTSGGQGGTGGGGSVPNYNSPSDGNPGTDGLGGGGAGGQGWGSGGTGGAGGDGIVIIRRKTVDIGAGNLTLVSNATTAETQPTKADLVMTYTNGAGTATIGTDLTAEVSRDNGSTYTSFGLSASSDQGDTGGHTILTAHDVDISGQPAGSAMRYRIKTLNQGGSKETRIQAVSLGWS